MRPTQRAVTTISPLQPSDLRGRSRLGGSGSVMQRKNRRAPLVRGVDVGLGCSTDGADYLGPPSVAMSGSRPAFACGRVTASQRLRSETTRELLASSLTLNLLVPGVCESLVPWIWLTPLRTAACCWNQVSSCLLPFEPPVISMSSITGEPYGAPRRSGLKAGALVAVSPAFGRCAPCQPG